MTDSMSNATPDLALFYEYYPCKANPLSQTAVVLLHGWGLHGGIWAQVIRELELHFNCIVIDLPGMGRSPLSSYAYTLENITSHILNTLATFDYSYHLVGWSLGAVIATEVTRTVTQNQGQRNIQVLSLTTLAMGPWFIAPPEKLEDVGGMSAIEFNYFQNLLAEDFEGTLFRFLSLNAKGSLHQRAEIRLLQQLTFSFGFPGPKALAGGLEILKNAKIGLVLDECQVPIYMVFGANDAIVPLSFMAWLAAQHPTIKVEIMAGAGHIPFLSQPQEFVAKLINFLQKK